ncbi:MAG: U32 family peptidase [Lachnospiraceae bacterium]|nr:U32 family peptidase [Lachnospiraceae bacterium]MDY5742006.1 U32 family peptidase [Lachnospiraceae bacterium]
MKIELLAPATSVEGIYGAIRAGANAIYFGGTKFSARAFADNLTIEQMRDVFHYGHLFGVSFYITINTLLKNREMEKELYDYFAPIYEAGVDGVLVQDLGVLSFIHQFFPDVAIHISTQMSLLTAEGARLAKRLGATRIVLARETSLADIKSIHAQADIELEVFAHGALCYCYSGQCLFSSILGGRSGNRGRCAQACRLPYTVDGQQQHYLSPRDLCTLELIPDLVDAGVASLKIEGRMKRNEYTAMVVSLYRKYLDLYQILLEEDQQNGTTAAKQKYRVSASDIRLLEKLYSRGSFTTGYLERHNGKEMLNPDKPGYNQKNEELLKQIREEYLSLPKQYMVSATVYASPGQPIRMQTRLNGRELLIEGPVAEAARQHAMTKEEISGHIAKTGGTAFAFSDVEVKLEGDVFIPVGGLKRLRRDFLDAVHQTLVPIPARTINPYSPLSERNEDEGIVGKKVADRLPKQTERVQLQVRIEQEEMLETVLTEQAVTAVILDILLSERPDPAYYQFLTERIHAVGKAAIYALPRVSREKDLAEESIFLDPSVGFDGVLARSVDQLGLLESRGYRGRIYTDHSVSVLNERTAFFLKSRGIIPTLSLELNQKELKHMPVRDSALQVYGLIPMMVTAGCLRKSRSGCTGKVEELEMIDRFGTVFPVKTHCRYCYNIIYNSLPQVLLENQLRQQEPLIVRVDFVNESAKRIKMVLTAVKTYYLDQREIRLSGEFTRGHYKRGIE